MFIRQQRVRERQTRSARLAIVAGNFVEEVNPKAEVEKADEFMSASEDTYSELITALRFYSDAENYKDDKGRTNFDSPVQKDNGLLALKALKKLI